MFGQFSEMMNSEAQFKGDHFRQEANRDRLARQVKSTRQDKRNKLEDVLEGVKRGKLSIEEGLNLLENA